MPSNLLFHVWTVSVFVLHLLVVARALTRPNRAPASRVAWVAAIMLLPVGASALVSTSPQ